jgi:hypothetical protein
VNSRWATTLSVLLALVLVVAFGGIALARVANRWEARRTAVSGDTGQAQVPAGPGPTDDVALVGDSITEQADETFHTTLQPPYRLRVSGRGGYRIEEMEPYAIELATGKPEQVVINLGTNDVLRNWPLEKSVAALNRMVNEFRGTRCLHLVTISEHIVIADDPSTKDRAEALNAEIRRLAQSRAFDVIDWTALVGDYVAQGEPEGPITNDTIHPTELGRKKLSDLYRQGLDRCA